MVVTHHFEPGTVILRAKNVAFSYTKERELLVAVNLEVKSGEICCLMGPNGCGKSTFIDCILGEHTLEHGSVLVADNEVSRFAPARLATYLSYVPQTHLRSFPYTVEHVVLMGMLSQRDLFDRPQKEDYARALEMLERVGIGHLATRPYTQISGGETQLVLLARALAQDADLIIMDEPTAHLDFKNDLVFMETVQRLIKQEGLSVLIATHSPNLAFYFESTGVPTRVAMLNDGQIAQDGAPTQVLTEEALATLYGINAKVLIGTDDAGRTFRYVAPLSTRSM